MWLKISTMANAAGGYTDSGLAFERKWVEGLRTFSTTRPSAPWRSASTGPAVWRHYPVWTPLPIWSEWPESLVPPKPPFEETLEGRKCATAAKAAASLRSPRPSTVIDARGRRQPAVGTGMKELRMQLAAVAAEVAARAAHAQEVTGGAAAPCMLLPAPVRSDAYHASAAGELRKRGARAPTCCAHPKP